MSEEPQRQQQQAQREFVCLEFPAAVANPRRALDMVGGESAVSGALDGSGGFLSLRFRPDRHPAFGEQQRTRSLLLRVDLGDPGGQPRSRVEGVVSTTFKFHGMFDFQFSRCDPAAADPESSAAQCIAPAVFSRRDQPYSLDLRTQVPSAARGSEGGVAVAAGWRRERFGVPANVPEVPGGAPEELDEKRLSEAQGRALEEVRAMFQKRPVLTQAEVFGTVGPLVATMATGAAQMEVKLVLAHAGFVWGGGPWRRQCCRFGYDPRKDPEARRWQSVYVRPPLKVPSADGAATTTTTMSAAAAAAASTWRKQAATIAERPKRKPTQETTALKLEEAEGAPGSEPLSWPEFSQLTLSSVVPGRLRSVFSVSELDGNKRVRELVAREPRAEYSSLTGWFTPETYEELFQIFKVAVANLRQGASLQEVVDVTCPPVSQRGRGKRRHGEPTAAAGTTTTTAATTTTTTTTTTVEDREGAQDAMPSADEEFQEDYGGDVELYDILESEYDPAMVAEEDYFVPGEDGGAPL